MVLPRVDPPAASLSDVAAVLGAAQAMPQGALPATQRLAEASAAAAASEADLATAVSGALSAALLRYVRSIALQTQCLAMPVSPFPRSDCCKF